MLDRIAGGHFRLHQLGRNAACRRARGHQRRRALGARQSRMHDRDLDPLGPEFVGQVLGHRGHGHVAHAAHRIAGTARGQATDIHDTAPAFVLHGGRHFARAAQVTHHLGIHFGMEKRAGDLAELRRGGKTGRLRRRIDQDVDAAAELLHRQHKRLAHLLVAGGIGAHAHHAPPRLRGQLGRRGSQGLRIARQQRHIGTFLRQHAGDGLADAAAAAGDQGALATSSRSMRRRDQSCDARS